MYEKSKAIVLRVHKLDDEKRIVEVYTQLRGFLSFRITQKPGKNSKMRTTYFLPLNILELEYDYRERFEVQTIHDLSLQSSMQMACFNPYKSAIVLFLAEFLVYVLRKEPQNDTLFSFLEESFAWLEKSESDFTNFHLLFLTHMTSFLGIPPSMETFVPGSYFDMQESTFVQQPPAHSLFIEPEYATMLALVSRASYATMQLIVLSRKDRVEYLRILTHYYQLHFPGFPDLKSQAVLSDLFE